MPKSSQEDIQILIGLRIKELRAESDLTQESLAFRAGLDRTYINSVENGRRNISAQAISKIADAFDMGLQTFFDSDLFENKGKK